MENIFKNSHSKVKERRVARVLYISIVVAVVIMALVFITGGKMDSKNSPPKPPIELAK